MNRYTALFIRRLPSWILFFLAMTYNGAMATAMGGSSLHLAAGSHQIDVEVAATPGLRRLGLMNRDYLSDNHGMLFVFPETRVHCMWMHHTRIPLSAAFIDAQGMIVKIADMLPDTNDYHCAETAVQYVIEMRSGWFREKNIAPGAYIKGLDKAPIGQ